MAIGGIIADEDDVAANASIGVLCASLRHALATVDADGLVATIDAGLERIAPLLFSLGAPRRSRE